MKLFVYHVEATVAGVTMVEHIHHWQHESVFHIVTPGSRDDKAVDAAEKLFRPVMVLKSVFAQQLLHLEPLQVDTDFV